MRIDSLSYPRMGERYQNFQGIYLATDVLAESELHSRVIQRNLIPKLNVLIAILRDEPSYEIEKEFPDCSGK